MKTQITISRDARDFLEAVIFAYPEDESGANPLSERSAYDFSSDFVSAVESFISGFRSFLDERGVEIPDCDRSFGGNVYFSLSGHGCGFWDSNETEHIQPLLEKYAGSRYAFEQLDLCDDENGHLDLAFLPEYRAEYRRKMFSPKGAK
jgi:hypothetical protein